MWEIVNKERRRRKGINEGIEGREWREYFMKLLGGVEGRVIRGGMGRRVDDGEEELRRSEVRKVLEKLEKGKAMRADGVPNEV